MKTIITGTINTTNGTSAIQRCEQAAHIVVGSFLNASRVVEFVRQLDVDISIVCAGWRNRVSLEDTLCAGLILYELCDGQEPEDRTDTAHIAFTQYSNDRDNLEASVRRSGHGKRLARLGREADVDFCVRQNAVPVLPYLDENQLVLLQ
jgi:2-phosphosulfolactate phosphatase